MLIRLTSLMSAVVCVAFLAVAAAGVHADGLPAEYGNGSVAQVLKNVKADPGLVNRQFEHGYTLLHHAVSSNDLEMAKMLLAEGADVNLGEECGFAPLHLAESLEMARLLVGRGADVNKTHTGGRTPLYMAVIEDRKAVVAFLIEKGADPGIGDGNGTTPLHVAAAFGHSAEIVKTLLVAGAGLDARDKLNGATPLESAEARKDAAAPRARSVISLLRAASKGTPPGDLKAVDPVPTFAELCDAASRGYAGEVRYLLNVTPSLAGATDANGATALHHAVVSGDTALLKLLIERKLDATAAKKDGVTPLHVAASLGKAEVAKVLMEAGADPNAADKKGRTPLSLAKEKGAQDVIAVLSGIPAGSEAALRLADIELGSTISEVRKLYGEGNLVDEGGERTLQYRDPSGEAVLWVQFRPDDTCWLISLSSDPSEAPKAVAASKPFMNARTATGIRLGSTETDVFKVYGKVQYEPYGDRKFWRFGIGTADGEVSLFVVTEKDGVVTGLRLSR